MVANELMNPNATWIGNFEEAFRIETIIKPTPADLPA
jgi:hypothetical protein